MILLFNQANLSLNSANIYDTYMDIRFSVYHCILAFDVRNFFSVLNTLLNMFYLK